MFAPPFEAVSLCSREWSRESVKADITHCLVAEVFISKGESWKEKACSRTVSVFHAVNEWKM